MHLVALALGHLPELGSLTWKCSSTGGLEGTRCQAGKLQSQALRRSGWSSLGSQAHPGPAVLPVLPNHLSLRPTEWVSGTLKWGERNLWSRCLRVRSSCHQQG